MKPSEYIKLKGGLEPVLAECGYNLKRFELHLKRVCGQKTNTYYMRKQAQKYLCNKENFVFPDIKDDILNAMKRTFHPESEREN